MSAEFHIDLPKRLTGGPAELVREWNRMIENQRKLAAAIQARTLRPSATTRVQVSPGGSYVNVKPTRAGRGGGGLLPFQISVTSDTLKAAPGTLDGDTIAETTESSPADGTWYLEAAVTINSSTGAVTATAVDWVSSLSTPSATEFYDAIGEVDVVSGTPDASSIVQYNYGPLLVIQYGAVSNKWGVLIF